MMIAWADVTIEPLLAMILLQNIMASNIMVLEIHHLASSNLSQDGRKLGDLHTLGGEVRYSFKISVRYPYYTSMGVWECLGSLDF